MPLNLPTGTVIKPIVPGLDTIMAGPRVTGYRFDLLDNEENEIGTLDTVAPGGSVETSAYAAVKGMGSIVVTDRGKELDWLNLRIRPVALLSSVGVDDPTTDVACGVYIPSAPVEDWNHLSRSWNVELLDKNSLLDTDIVTDGLGTPITYSVPAGANVLDTVAALIQGAGESAAAIGTSSKVLANPMTWEVGTSRLSMINDLLGAADYFSLACDGNGQYQAVPYLSPGDRPPVYNALAPLSAGEASLMDPSWKRDRDIYAIPNRYVCIGTGSGDTPALVGVATNVDPDSPYSFQNRGDGTTENGRWLTRVVTGVEAISQADIDSAAKRGLTQATAVSAGLSVKHIFLPDIQVNRTIRFVNAQAGIDILTYVTKTTIPFDPTMLASSELREAAV